MSLCAGHVVQNLELSPLMCRGWGRIGAIRGSLLHILTTQAGLVKLGLATSPFHANSEEGKPHDFRIPSLTKIQFGVLQIKWQILSTILDVQDKGGKEEGDRQQGREWG